MQCIAMLLSIFDVTCVLALMTSRSYFSHWGRLTLNFTRYMNTSDAMHCYALINI